MKTFKLHLIRHGMTAGNLQGLYIGSGTDIPLCDEGRAQLKELKERFEYPQVDTVFSSPLVRAVETANILFPNAGHQFTVHDLREAGFGVFENRPVKDLVKEEDFKKWITPGSGFVPEGAEPTEQFHARCAETLLKLFEALPERFDLTYIGEDGQKHRPVVIHRAILGSSDRFISFLLEETKGNLPLWLVPTQVKILPISEKQNDYCEELLEKVQKAGIRVAYDSRNEKIGYKIREAQMEKIPYMLVVGDKEKEENKVTVRSRSKADLGTISIDEFIEKVLGEIKDKKSIGE